MSTWIEEQKKDPDFLALYNRARMLDNIQRAFIYKFFCFGLDDDKSICDIIGISISDYVNFKSACYIEQIDLKELRRWYKTLIASNLTQRIGEQ